MPDGTVGLDLAASSADPTIRQAPSESFSPVPVSLPGRPGKETVASRLEPTDSVPPRASRAILGTRNDCSIAPAHRAVRSSPDGLTPAKNGRLAATKYHRNSVDRPPSTPASGTCTGEGSAQGYPRFAEGGMAWCTHFSVVFGVSSAGATQGRSPVSGDTGRHRFLPSPPLLGGRRKITKPCGFPQPANSFLPGLPPERKGRKKRVLTGLLRPSRTGNSFLPSLRPRRASRKETFPRTALQRATLPPPLPPRRWGREAIG